MPFISSLNSSWRGHPRLFLEALWADHLGLLVLVFSPPLTLAAFANPWAQLLCVLSGANIPCPISFA